MKPSLPLLAGAALALAMTLGPLPEAVAAIIPETEAGIRTWTSLAGSQRIGFLKEQKDNVVILVGEDDSEIEVPVEQLSYADRAYLHETETRRHQTILAFYRDGIFRGLELPESAEVKGVRHVSQRENFCVPASAEMILRFYGYSYDQNFLAGITSRDSARSAGTNFTDLIPALRNLGVMSVLIRNRQDQEKSDFRINAIRAGLAEGRPVLLSYETSQSGHAVVAVAYNDRRRAFWVMDPAGRASPQRLDYKVLENILTGVLVVVPEPKAIQSEADDDGEKRRLTLRRISEAIQAAEPSALRDLVDRLEARGLASRWRDTNRRDITASQGQTRSFARQQGVEFVHQSLERGMIIVAPQTFEEGSGLILLHGRSGNDFQAVEYLPDGTLRNGDVRALDFSLRWLWRDQNRFLLPIVEIGPLH